MEKYIKWKILKNGKMENGKWKIRKNLKRKNGKLKIRNFKRKFKMENRKLKK